MIRRFVISPLMTIDFFCILGLGGSFERDVITTAQFITYISICMAVFIFLDFLRSTKIKASHGGNHKRHM